MVAQPLGFTQPQPFRVCLWQAHMPPGADSWPMPGVHCVATPSAASSKGEPHSTHLCYSHSINMIRHTAFGAQRRVI